MRGGRSGLTSFRPKKLLDVNKMFHCKNVYFSYSICIYSVERSGKHRGISWMIMDFLSRLDNWPNMNRRLQLFLFIIRSAGMILIVSVLLSMAHSTGLTSGSGCTV